MVNALAACALVSCVLEGKSVDLVDSAKETNKARAVVGIYRIPLKRGDTAWLAPL